MPESALRPHLGAAGQGPLAVPQVPAVAQAVEEGSEMTITWTRACLSCCRDFQATTPHILTVCPVCKVAPDLLAALERVMAYLSIHDPTYAESNADSVMAHAAIAKAKGVTP